jgi:signal transduction histidine kinase
VNDMFLVSGKFASLYLLPQGFLVYAFAVGSTLLIRYRKTAGELEVAAIHLRERTEELRHSHAELKEIQDELVKKQQLAAVGELAAAIAHEVRNPLAVIVNAVAGLRRSGLREEDRHMLLGIVDEETARLNRLVTDLLRFARPVTVKRSAVSIAELAKRPGELAKYDGEVRVHVADDPDIQTVWVDPGLFRLVLDNLVENAFQAMSGNGTVEIDVKRELVGAAPYVRVEIRDTGHGMDDRVRERAIAPFFTTRPSGTGLGLPIVERILEAHGGRLEIDSEPARGTTVSLIIPVGAEPDQDSSKLA